MRQPADRTGAPARAGPACIAPAELVILAVTVIGAIAGIAGLATGAITAQEAAHD